MSQFSINTAAAAAAHRDYFGNPSGVSWRANANCEWETLAGAVVHGEQIRWVKKGNPQVSARVVQRVVYIDTAAAAVNLNAHIKVDDCNHIYTVVETLVRGYRIALTLQRAEVSEITRPNYRHTLR
jgi:hypothetical protein